MAQFGDHFPEMALAGLKIDPLSEIRNAGIVTNGSVMWVRGVGDSDFTAFKDAVGAANLREDIQGGIDALRNDKNDYVMVVPRDGGSVWALGTAVDVNKNRLHMLSVGYTRAMHGFSNTLQGYVAASGIDTSIVDVTGAGVELGGFEIRGTSGTAAGGTISGGFLRLGTASTGTAHGAWVHDVKIENTQAAAAGGTTVLVAFDGNVPTGIRGVRFDRSWIGDWSWAPTPMLDFGAGTAGPARTEFVDCTFVMDAQATTDGFVTLGTGVTEYTSFERCKFVNVEAGTAPASAVTGAILVDNPAVLIDCTAVNVTAFGTDTELLVVPNDTKPGGTSVGAYNPRIGFIGTTGIVVGV